MERRYALAIAEYQSILRNNRSNSSAWIGLGEAYYHTGRYGAAEKAFIKASSLDETSWLQCFLVAGIQRLLGKFEEAHHTLEIKLQQHDEYPLHVLQLQILLQWSKTCFSNGRIQEAADLAMSAVQKLGKLIPTYSKAAQLQILKGQAFEILSGINSDYIDSGELTQRYTSVQNIREADGELSELLDALHTENKFKTLELYIISCECFLAAANMQDLKPSILYSSSLFNAALILLKLGDALRGRLQRIALITSAKILHRCLNISPNNSLFWNVLGICLSVEWPLAAEKAFYRSLQGRERNCKLWNDLGAFYLVQNDMELAELAALKAQSIGPADVHVLALWSHLTKKGYSKNIPTSGVSLGAASSSGLISSLSLALSENCLNLFRKTMKSDFGLGIPLGQVYFLLRKSCQLSGDLWKSEILLIHVMELLGMFDSACELLDSVIKRMEELFEETEDEQIFQFLKVVLAVGSRVYLAIGDYEESLRLAEASLDLETPESPGNQLHFGCQIVKGLCYYYMGDPSKSFQQFEICLNESGDDTDSVILVAQALWATHKSEEQDVAFEQLIGSRDHGIGEGHTETLFYLTAISILGRKRELYDDLMTALTRAKSQNVGFANEIDSLLSTLACRFSFHLPYNFWQASLFFSPSNWQAWEKAGQNKASPPLCNQAFLILQSCVDMSSTDISRLLACEISLSSKQAAVFLTPWRPLMWSALASNAKG